MGASDTVDVDAVDPTITVDIVATALNEDGTSAVTFTFSEAVGAGSFTLDDIDAEGGTVTGLTQTARRAGLDGDLCAGAGLRRDGVGERGGWGVYGRGRQLRTRWAPATRLTWTRLIRRLRSTLLRRR